MANTPNLQITHYLDINKNTVITNQQKVYLKVKQGTILNLKSIDSKLRILPSLFNSNVNLMNIDTKQKKYLNDLINDLNQYISSLNNREKLTKEDLNKRVNSFHIKFNNLLMIKLLNDYKTKIKATLKHNDRTAFSSFIEFLKVTNRNNASITLLSNDLINEFELYLLDKLAEATTKTYMNSIIKFANKFIYATQFDLKLITYKTISKRNTNKDFKDVYLTTDELILLKEHLKVATRRDKRLIDILFLGIITALRYSDLLELENVIKSNKELLHGSSIQINQQQSEEIYSIKTRKLTEVCNNQFIQEFFNTHELLSHKYFNKELKKLLQKLNFNRQIKQHEGTRNNKKSIKVPLHKVASSHIMRRTAITNCYLDTKDIYLAMQLANHADLDTTIKYLKLSDIDNFKLKRTYTDNVVHFLTY